MEAKDADEMKGFHSTQRPGLQQDEVDHFPCGLSPSPARIPSSTLDSELSFFEEFAKSEGYRMAYYTASLYSSPV
jgi:hypothetical protein